MNTVSVLPGQPHDAADPVVPELLLISALLEAGKFAPAAVGVTEEHLNTHEKCWRFCVDYQTKVGSAPSVEEVKARFPDFVFIPNVGLSYAALQVIEAAEERELRRGLQRTIRRLTELGITEAIEELKPLLVPKGNRRPSGYDLFDPDLVGESVLRPGWPVPYPKLQAVTQGIGRGELWYLASRLGMGKTWLLCLLLAHAAKAGGANITILSLEMPARTLSRRLHGLLAPDAATRNALRADNPDVRKRALAKIKDDVPGTIKVIDPSMTRVDTAALPELATDTDILGVDYVAKMTHGGKHAMEDYRILAMISDALQKTAVTHNIGVVSAAQINREGDTGGLTPPKLSHLADSDAIPRDGDVVVTFKRPADEFWSLSAEKVREGPNARWYAQFRPDVFDFAEIGKERALELHARAGAAALMQ